MASSSIDVSLRLRNAKRFEQDAKKAGTAVGGIGKGAGKASKDLNKVERSATRAHKGFLGLSRGAKLAMGAIGGAAAFGAAKNAITTTTSLTKTVMGLQRATKMDSQEATRWAAQAKVRGIDTKALNMAMGTLSKNQTLATEGGKAQLKAFGRLGITQKDIAATGGDLSKLLPTMADNFKRMGPSAERTASMMALMGRGWQTLTPLLVGGSKAMDEQLKMADKYGVTLGGKPIKTQKDLIQVQREMAMAQLGWQVQFSTVIAPKLIKAFRYILGVSQSLKGVFSWADRHPQITKAIASIVLLSAVMKRVPGGTWLTSHILAGTGGIGGKLLKRLGGPVRQALRRVLGGAGTSAGGLAAENIVNSTGSMFGRKSPRLNNTIGGRLTRIGRRAGTLGGKAAGLAFVAGAVLGLATLHVEVGKVLNSVNQSVDKWAKDKFGAAGSVYSDIKNFVAQNYPSGLPGSDIIHQLGAPKRNKATGHTGFNLPHRQHGGPIRAGMSALVGEAGPELLTARGGGGFIRPLGTPSLNVPQLAMPGGYGDSGDILIRFQPTLDGRVLSDSVERVTRKKRARR